MEKTKLGYRAFCHCSLLYLLTLPFWGAFALYSDEGTGFWRMVFLWTTVFSYSAVTIAPAMLFDTFAWLSRGKHKLSWIWMFLAGLWVFLVHFVLLVDYFILLNFGYHINGLVINLLLTPGGFEAMGLDAATLVPVYAGIAVAIAFQVWLTCFCRKSSLWGKFSDKYVFPLRWSLPIFTAICLVISLLCTGFADFFLLKDTLVTYDSFPHIHTIRMRSLLRSLGFEQVKNNGPTGLLVGDGKLEYPVKGIMRKEERKHTNIVWLVSESLRYSLLNAETMPHAWALSEQGHRFECHYSGGNGTRPGMFSMFYALYGCNWDNFLRNRRAPLVMDWLREDNAQFLCQTSAKFSYPEFDQTIFAGVPSESMNEMPSKKNPAERDVLLVENAIQFVRNRDKNRPFFLFGFFESTHAPYSFPPENVLKTNYPEHINYATVSKKDAEGLYNRDINAAHHVDAQIGRLLDVLRQENLIEETIVIITGDHGEEFYEKGRLGHNSTFVEEQTHVPLALWIPGAGHAVHTKLTHHTDIVPTLAPYLGVTNPAEDFSVGGNLLDMDYQRSYCLICGWDEVVFVNLQRKARLPLGNTGFFKKRITDFNDNPLPDDDFFVRYAAELVKVQQDMTRFLSK